MFCSDIPSPFLFFFSSHVSSLLYYSHIPAAIISLVIGIFVFVRHRQIAGLLLFLISLSFSVWSLLDLLIWVNVDSRIIMASWSVMGFVSSLMFVLCLYFVAVFIDKKDVDFKYKVIFLLLLLPLVVLTPSIFNLEGFDLDSCEAAENLYYSAYYYFIGFLSFVWILIFAIDRYRKADVDFRKQIVYLTLGVEFFLLSFFTTGFLASFLVDRGLIADFGLEQYGLFGMTFFMGMLAYLIVRFKAFSIKLITAQALVISLIILIASQFAFIQNPTNRILTGITLFIVSIFGWQLIKSVKREIAQREELEIANAELKKLDDAKNEFINIASHQLRTPITVIKGVMSMIMDGTMDQIPEEKRKELYKGAMIKSQKLEEIIHDILNTNALNTSGENNKMNKPPEVVELDLVLGGIVNDLKAVADEKQVDLSLTLVDAGINKIFGQKSYLEEAFSNLINNAIKYTPSPTFEINGIKREKAFVDVSIENKNNGILIKISDNGIGIAEDEMPKMFKKFSRAKNAAESSVDGTGLGLYIVKEIIESHSGKIWIESIINEGTTFFVWLPIRPLSEIDVKRHIVEKK